MLPLLPRTSFVIQSDLSSEAIAQKLTPHVSPLEIIRWANQKSQTPYQGELSSSGFKFLRMSPYRNAFTPVIIGKFQALSQGTAVHIKMRSHFGVLLFCVVWSLGWLGLGSIPQPSTGPHELRILAVMMPLTLIGVAGLSFYSEASRSRRDLLRMIGGHIIVPNNRDRATRSPVGLGFDPPSRARSNRQPWLLTGLGVAVVALVILLQQQQSARQAQVAANPIADPAAVCDAPCRYATLHRITGHPAATVVAVSPDGSLMASGGDDKAIKVWDVQTGQLVHTLQSDSGKITALAIASDNQTIVSGAGDRRLRIWELRAPSNWPKTLKHDFEPKIVRITSDGKSILSATHVGIKRWNLATGELLSKSTESAAQVVQTDPPEFALPAPYARVFAINQTGTVAVVQDGSDLLALDLAHNRQVKLPMNPQWNSISQLALSPNGKVVASQHPNNWRRYETRLKVWDLSQGRLQTEQAMDFSRRFFPSPPMVLTNAQVIGSVDGQLKAWDFDVAGPGQMLNEQELTATGKTKFQRIAMSSNGKVLARLNVRDSGETSIHLLQRQSFK